MSDEHRHQSHHDRGPYGWTHCVASGGCDGAAHGGIVTLEICACGAERSTETNGRHERSGPWRMPKCKACGYHHAADTACPVTR
jgi:hypothetical protein